MGICVCFYSKKPMDQKHLKKPPNPPSLNKVEEKEISLQNPELLMSETDRVLAGKVFSPVKEKQSHLPSQLGEIEPKVEPPPPKGSFIASGSNYSSSKRVNKKYRESDNGAVCKVGDLSMMNDKQKVNEMESSGSIKSDAKTAVMKMKKIRLVKDQFEVVMLRSSASELKCFLFANFSF